MPNRATYLEQYRDPYSGIKVAKDRPKVLGKSLFSRRATNLVPRGHFKLVGLPEMAVGIGSDNMESRAVSRAQYPQLTVLERIFLQELFKRHLTPGVDFEIQEKIAGGKQMPGGYAPDFTLYRPQKTAVEVQGEIYHQGLVPAVRDEVKAMYEKSIGFEEVLYIHEDELRSDDLTQAWFQRELGM